MKRLSILCAVFFVAAAFGAACDSPQTESPKLPDPPPGASADGAYFCCPTSKPSDDCVLAVDTCPDKLLWCEEVKTGDDGTKSCSKWGK